MNVDASAKLAGLGPDELFNGPNQEKMMEAYTKSNANSLKKLGLPDTPEFLSMAHAVGAKGSKQLIDAQNAGRGRENSLDVLGYRKFVDGIEVTSTAVTTNPQLNTTVDNTIAKLQNYAKVAAPTAADGGMFKGPRSGYAATLHGMEAVIPLKNGSVPVSLSMKDITAAGGNNQLPNLVEEIRNKLTELKTQNNSDTATSELRTIVQDFKTVILTAVETMSAKGNQSDFRNIEYMLAEMVRGQQASVDVQQKMLQVARN